MTSSKKAKRKRRKERRKEARWLRASAATHVMMDGAPIELIAAEEGDDQKLRRFKMKAYSGGPMRPKGFYYPAVADLKGIKADGKTLPCFMDHNTREIVGHTDDVTIGSTVNAAGVVSGAGEAAREVLASANNGFPWQASMGGPIHRMNFIPEGEKIQCNGRSYAGPIYVIRKMTLKEISFTPMGADPRTRVSIAASAAKEIATMQFDAWLEAKGFDPETHSDNEWLRAQFDAEMAEGEKPKDKGKNKTPATPQTVEASADSTPQPGHDGNSAMGDLEATMADWRKRQAEEVRRTREISELCAKHENPKIEVDGKKVDLESHAIENDWSRDKVELEAIRAARPSGPALHSHSSGAPVTADVLEAAVCADGGLKSLEDDYSDKTLQAAHSRFRGGIGLQEFFLEAAWAHGHTGRRWNDNPRDVLRAAFGQLQASFSTFDVSGILSNIANKFIKQSFLGFEQSWRQIASIRPVKDFKQITSYRLNGDMKYEKVGPQGEIKHGELGEDTFTNKADTYAKMFGISRTDFINDDLGALSGVPKLLGRGAALAFLEVFWTVFLANSDFFKSANKNYVQGAATAFGIDALTTLETLFLDQVDSNDAPLGIEPAILLVPNALWTPAGQIEGSDELRDTTASKKYGVKNPHQGKWKAVRSSYLSNATISGYSTKAFYLLADPMIEAVIEACFLNGQEMPTIESADAAFNVLGVEMRGYHDFGVSRQEHRGGVKSKGEA